jgi:hypothetical protein
VRERRDVADVDARELVEEAHDLRQVLTEASTLVLRSSSLASRAN